jgi:hypothetical protein
MTIDRWILLVIGLFSAFNILALRLVAVGRWAQKLETDTGNKPKVTLERLGWEIEAIAKDIKDLRQSFDGRYAELAAKVTADHIELREIRSWKAGLLVELGQHFHPIGIIDRMAEESEKDRAGIHDRLSVLESIVNRRQDLRT